MRTLRSKKLRAALWQSTGGKCAIAAGHIKVATVLQRIRKHWAKATDEERAEFRIYLLKGGAKGGAIGGAKSRRVLTTEQENKMVAAKEKKREARLDAKLARSIQAQAASEPYSLDFGLQP